MAAHGSAQPEHFRRELGTLRGPINRMGLGLVGIGTVAALAHLLLAGEGWRRFMLAYLVAFAFVLSLSLGGLFFVLIQHLFRSGWSVLLRRLPESLAANLGLVALMFIPIGTSVLLGQGEIYPWARPLSARVDHHPSPLPMSEMLQTHGHEPSTEGIAEIQAPVHGSMVAAPSMEQPHPVAHVKPGYIHQQLDDMTLKKRAWLNPPLFVGRWIVFLGIWSAMGLWFWRHSVKQDDSGDWQLTAKMESLAPPLTLVFAVTVTLGVFDLLMSLNPHWYSTIFGVYYFAGCVVGVLCVLILMSLWLAGNNKLPGVGVEHQHDLGKLLFAFVFFWGYIAYSQYMLLWYANMPEFTGWLMIRGATTVPADMNAWTGVILVLLAGHFLAPFAMLLSRHVKRRAMLLAIGAIWLLGMHWLDLIWLVMPELGPQLSIGMMEVGSTLALSGVYLLGVGYTLGRAGLIPIGDPRLSESVAFENM